MPARRARLGHSGDSDHSAGAGDGLRRRIRPLLRPRAARPVPGPARHRGGKLDGVRRGAPAVGLVGLSRCTGCRRRQWWWGNQRLAVIHRYRQRAPLLCHLGNRCPGGRDGGLYVVDHFIQCRSAGPSPWKRRRPPSSLEAVSQMERAMSHVLKKVLLAGLVAAPPLYLAACDPQRPLAPEIRAAAVGGSTLSAPSNPTAIAVSVSRIDLSWRDNSPNQGGPAGPTPDTRATGPFTWRANLAANTSAYGDTGLTAGTQYCYELRAFQTKGAKTHVSAFSATACATTPAPPPPPPPPPPPTPSAPGQVSAGLMTGITDWVPWVDYSKNEDGVRVDRSGDGTNWMTVGSIGPSSDYSVLFVDTTWTIEQSACYRVIAFNAAGGSPSSVACTPPLLGPTLLTMVGDDLAWADNSSVESGYQLWFMDVDGGPAYEGLAGTYPANTTSITALGPCPLR